MATPRLPFLWPMLAKGFEGSNPAARSIRAAARNRAFHSPSRRRLPDVVPQQSRYGTANQPPPHLSDSKDASSAKSQQAAEVTKALPKIGEKLQKDGEAEVKAEQQSSKKKAASKAEPASVERDSSKDKRGDPVLDAADSTPIGKLAQAPSTPPDHPLESLLETVPDPTKHAEEQKQESSSSFATKEDAISTSFDEHSPSVKAPHISTPRHVHHFDTYGFMRRLAEGGWTEAQAITIMKGMRVMLADNMDIAREALVSKSQVENETYLFRAACAELKTEVTSRRKAEQEKMRTERTQLQHEVEILSQRVGQESGTLKDELKGMFDDRKMAVRNEQREMESKVQRLNYQITVDLQADAKSEVEGLRWVMTRRVIIALATVILMVIGSLKVFSNAVHEQELEAKRKANMRSGGTQTDRSNNGGSDGGEGGGDGRNFGGGMSHLKEGDNPAYVTLG